MGVSAFEGLDPLCPDRAGPFDFPRELRGLTDLAANLALGPTTESLVDEARRRGIPVLRLNEQSLVRLGYGKFQQRICASVTARTSSIAVEVASDKALTCQLLSDADLSQPLRETGGGIVEVNAGPGFRMHLQPSGGLPREVARPVIGMLFPPGTPSRAPIVAIMAITGTNGKTTTARMVAHALKLSGRHVGLATTDGIYIDGALCQAGDLTGPWSARMVLKDPAVLEPARGGILREGLGFDRCDVGAVLNVRRDHLGMRGVETLEDLADVKALVVEVVREDGCSVLNADDPFTADMAGRAEGKIIYCSSRHGADSPPHLREHLAEGGAPGVLQPSGTTGERRDEGLRQLGAVATGFSHLLIIRQDDDLRGRPLGEAARRLREGALEAGLSPEQAGLSPEQTRTVLPEAEAVAEALRLAQPGDLVLVFGGDIARCWQQITGYHAPPTTANRSAGNRRSRLVCRSLPHQAGLAAAKSTVVHSYEPCPDRARGRQNHCARRNIGPEGRLPRSRSLRLGHPACGRFRPRRDRSRHPRSGGPPGFQRGFGFGFERRRRRGGRCGPAGRRPVRRQPPGRRLRGDRRRRSHPALGHGPGLARSAARSRWSPKPPRRAPSGCSAPGGIEGEADCILTGGGRHFEVFGVGAVYVLDGQGVSFSNVTEGEEEALPIHDVRLHVLSRGSRFDLEQRRPRAAQPGPF